MKLRHAVVVAAITILTTLGFVSTASAHAELLSMSPSAGAVLSSSPTQVVLTFDESVETVPGSIRVVAGDGTEMKLTSLGQSLGSDTISADVPELADGTYVVSWRAISADSHPVNGAYTFSVGKESATNAGLVASLLKSSGPKRSTENLLGIGRAASYLGVGVLIGGFFLLAWAAPDILRTKRAGVVLISAAAVGIAGTELMIAAQASLAVGDAARWKTVFDTPAGSWWFVRAGVLVLGFVMVLFRRRYSSAGAWPFASTVVAVALLASVAAGGHGITGRWIPVGFLATFVHLAAMSLWVGGLFILGLVVPRDRLWRTAARFSPLALMSVVALIITGTINAWRQAGSWSALTGSNYGTWFFIKIVLVAGVLGVAAASRWLVHRPPADADTSGSGSEAGDELVLASTVGAAALTVADDRALRRTVLAEAFGVLLIFAATSGLVSSAPPRELPAGPVSVSVLQGDRVAQVILDPAVTGGTVMHVYLSSITGALTQNPTITVSASLPAKNIGPLTIPVEASGPGHATTNDAVFPIAGSWSVTVTARYSEFDETAFVANFTIK
ncbi:MAG TPA: copper resistance protein CopC [Ilumatobacteraceae bacterium]